MNYTVFFLFVFVIKGLTLDTKSITYTMQPQICQITRTKTLNKSLWKKMCWAGLLRLVIYVNKEKKYVPETFVKTT